MAAGDYELAASTSSVTDTSSYSLENNRSLADGDVYNATFNLNEQRLLQKSEDVQSVSDECETVTREESFTYDGD
ncbi:hypothetical protein LPA44_01945 [Halobacterium sp. KA-4]|nr:hypothetical protein [Halobacterium sp. KA-4]MCD2198665.1 hypothetical protein [Halobacterium sp. KA-4]